MVRMALRLCVFGLANLNSADRAVCKQGLTFWMRYLDLGELDPVLDHCERVGYLEPEELKLLMGTGEFYKARYEKTVDALVFGAHVLEGFICGLEKAGDHALVGGSFVAVSAEGHESLPVTVRVLVNRHMDEALARGRS